jgi:hypothetical protein
MRFFLNQFDYEDKDPPSSTRRTPARAARPRRDQGLTARVAVVGGRVAGTMSEHQPPPGPPPTPARAATPGVPGPHAGRRRDPGPVADAGTPAPLPTPDPGPAALPGPAAAHANRRAPLDPAQFSVPRSPDTGIHRRIGRSGRTVRGGPSAAGLLLMTTATATRTTPARPGAEPHRSRRQAETRRPARRPRTRPTHAMQRRPRRPPGRLRTLPAPNAGATPDRQGAAPGRDEAEQTGATNEWCRPPPGTLVGALG